MDPLEVFKIEAPGEEYGRRKYREVLLDILQDLGLVRSIGKLLVYVDIEKPLFSAYGVMRGHLPPLKVEDVGEVARAEGGYQIKVDDEEHMADLLKVLWATYGREKVEQPDRDILTVSSEVPPNDLVVTDVDQEFRRDLTDALIRIAPEGFRNRRNEMTENSFFFIAAEETLTPSLIEEVKEKIRGMDHA
ncbi:MAG: methanogenesis marker 17 protein [Methanosarcinales archaeon]|nr:methanogenesis marker 17 protein [Methanosarcinales archaeon]